MANKVEFGIENVYYAVATIAADNSATYDTPVHLPGAINITLSKEGDENTFYADNIAYYVSNANNGYSGSLEVARITDEFAQDILGEIVDNTTGLQYEVQDVEPVHFALMFEFKGDEKKTRHVFYNCVASRPDIESSTQEDTIEPNTSTVDITAKSVYVGGAVAENVVKARCLEGDTAYSSFFTAVQLPTA